ncbi:MAG: acyl-CoA dehydrogenase family protein [Gammaproteobacteria bacterium]
MHDFFLRSEEQKAILESVRRFTDGFVTPVAATLDRAENPEECFSWDIVEQADNLGIRTLTLAEEYGGLGADSLTTAMVIEELARGDLGVSVVFAQTLKLVQTLQAAANDEQRARYLPAFRDDPRYLLAIGITEPETASDYFIPHAKPFLTSAARSEGGWVVNGMKHFISNGNRASLYLVFVQTEKGKTLADGSTCFLVERDTQGFSIGHVHDKMGERLANNAELIFEDCFIPDRDVVGETGKGFEVLTRFFPASNAYAAASVLGVAEAAFERALEWARMRVQGGKNLIEHDSVAIDLAEMRMLMDAARCYIHQAAWSADHRDRGWDPTLGALPKVFASRSAWDIVTKASEIFGGYGYMRDVGLEKLMRDAAAFLHSDGVNRTLLLKASKFII